MYHTAKTEQVDQTTPFTFKATDPTTQFTFKAISPTTEISQTTNPTKATENPTETTTEKASIQTTNSDSKSTKASSTEATKVSSTEASTNNPPISTRTTKSLEDTTQADKALNFTAKPTFASNSTLERIQGK
jgi:hypothetical protein